MVTSSPGDSLDNSVGTNVSFTCEASGMGLGRRWYRNGEEVSSGPRVVIRGSNMTLNGLLEGDSGMYQCSVSNGTSSVWRQWRVLVSSEYMYYSLRHYTCTSFIKDDVFVNGRCFFFFFFKTQVWSL